MTKLLTIAIPTYNREKACVKTVRNFLDQIKENKLEDRVQILVSDNCSEDSTYTKLEEIKKENPEILFINRNSRNLGFAKNCQVLLDNTNTQYIWTCGDDDTYSLNAVQTIIKHLEKEKLVYLFMNCWWPRGKNKAQKGVKITRDFYGSFIDAMDIIRDSASYMSLNVVDTKLLKEASWHSETWYMYEKIINMDTNGRSCVLSEPLVTYSYADKDTNWFHQDEKQLLFFSEMIQFLILERDNKVLSKFRFYMLDLYGRQLEQYLNSLRQKNGLKNFNQYKYRKYKSIYKTLLSIVLVQILIIIFLLFV